MFLFPAIGAGVSDALILFLYFSHQGSNGGHNNVATSTTGGWALNDIVGINRTIKGLSRISNESNHSSIFYNDIGGVHIQNIILPSSPTSHDRDYDEILRIEQMNDDIATAAIMKNDESTDNSSSNQTANNNDNENEHHKIKISSATVESETVYLAILAIIRLVLLMLPLSYAAWSGTRVPCAVVQYVFHGISSFIVVCHMLAVLTLDESASSMGGEDTIDSSAASSFGSGEGWTLMSLSLVSIMLHILIIILRPFIYT